MKEEVEDCNERDAHDFFLSVLDSPRQAASHQVQPDDATPHPHKHGLPLHSSMASASKGLRIALPEGDTDDDLVWSSSVEEPVDTGDIEEELADALANSKYETGDERGLVGSEFADAMDVDVEDELLSSVEPTQSDGPHVSQEPSLHSRHPGLLSRELENRRRPDHGRLSPESRDRLSMPPPMTTKGGKGAGKVSKSGTGSKDSATARMIGSSKEAKRTSSKAEDTSEPFV